MIGAVWLIILAAFELPGKNGSGHGHGENYKAHWWSFCVRSIFPGVSILQYFSVPHIFLQDSQDSSGLLYNFADFDPQDWDIIPAKLEYITSLTRGHVI